MLILSRKTSESFFINDNIEVKVIFIDRDRVKVGIKAPPEVSITRPDAKRKEPKREEP